MKKLVVMALVVGSLPFASGCHRSKEYEANVEITRTMVLRKDEAGAPTNSDAEFSYIECPGTQIEIIRGGKEFSECMKKYKVGDKVKVKLTHAWDPEGHWDYDVHELGGCKRPPDPNDEASYKMVRDCADWNVNGVRVGFECKYADKVELTKKCPWFKKH